MATPPRRTRLQRVVRWATTAGGITAALAAAAGWWAWNHRFLPWYEPIEADAIATIDAHWELETSHPGWSFHAQIFSAATPIDGLTPARLALEAATRGYVDACPPTAPGHVCAETGEILLRGGQFADGPQPAGNAGWTRPLALEPIELGLMVGPDAELREHLPLADAPELLLRAIIASEDERFERHLGVDPEGFARAMWVNWNAGAFSQGASTLDMQLMRNLTGDKDRSIERKLAEMARAYAVDQYAGKEQILQMYLDAPYLGQAGSFSVCGFEMAAQFYYGKSARDLDLSQAATLVGILPAPGNFSPEKYPAIAKEKRDRVLRRMRELGWDPAQIDAALAEPVAATPHELFPTERYYAYLAASREAVLRQFPPQVAYGAGLDVYTALDPVAQEATERVLEERTPFLDRRLYGRGEGPLLSASALVDTASGLLVAVHDTAILGSNDFNRATQMRRQAGSSFKPVVYALAFQPGPDGHPRKRPDSPVKNTPKTFSPGEDAWTPRNANGWYMPTVTLARGLTVSANLAAAHLLEELGGPDPLIDFASTLGFDTSGFPREMGLSLGQAQVTPVEMARFSGIVLGGGKKASASPIALAVDAFGRERFRAPPPRDQVLTPVAALYTRELMRLVVLNGTGWRVRGEGGYKGEVVGKTGTATGDRDLWFVGGTPDYAGAVWVGYELPASVGDHAGAVAGPLFGWWMDALHEGLELPKFDISALDRKYVCANTGLSGNETCPGIQVPFLKGEKPRGGCTIVHDPYDLAPPVKEEPLVEEGAIPAPATP